MMRIGSLFSGVGGLELGLERATGGHVVWQVERDEHARKVLERHWPGAQRFDDVRTVGAHNLEPVDIICGGFPCQDVSVAGKGAGLEGERSGLWREYARIVRELRPRFVVVENVAALLARGFGRVLGDLAEAGYDARWEVLRASDVGAPHRRERLFIVAWRRDLGPWRVSDSDSEQVRELAERVEQLEAIRWDAELGHVGLDMAHAQSQRRRSGRLPVGTHPQQPVAGESVGNVAHANGTRLEERSGVRADHGSKRAPAFGSSRHEFPPGPADADGWREYLKRHPGRAPALNGKLSPAFVEALMGFGGGWTAGQSRKNALRQLGNAVVPQVAELAWRRLA